MNPPYNAPPSLRLCGVKAEPTIAQVTPVTGSLDNKASTSASAT
jgi:hypothetical protein